MSVKYIYKIPLSPIPNSNQYFTVYYKPVGAIDSDGVLMSANILVRPNGTIVSPTPLTMTMSDNTEYEVYGWANCNPENIFRKKFNSGAGTGGDGGSGGGGNNAGSGGVCKAYLVSPYEMFGDRTALCEYFDCYGNKASKFINEPTVICAQEDTITITLGAGSVEPSGNNC